MKRLCIGDQVTIIEKDSQYFGENTIIVESTIREGGYVEYATLLSAWFTDNALQLYEEATEQSLSAAASIL
jgi:hypothetical protein